MLDELPNYKLHQTLVRQMTPAQRLTRALDSADLARRLAWLGLEQRYPAADEAELTRRFLSLTKRCRNKNS